MHQYIELLRNVMQHGTRKDDRTGTGTLSTFGYQMRFNLSEGFPLLTTKKMFIRGAIDELLWFISGSTNTNDIPERTRHWWSPWQKTDGSLGPIYGEQYRRARWWFQVEPAIYDCYKPEPGKRWSDVFIVPNKYKTRGQPRYIVMLKAVWRDMLKRCYDKESKAYVSYGALGVHVCPEWFDFGVFADDAQKLKNWSMKLTFPDDYTLDKDILRASNRYSPETCMWASHNEQSWNTSTNKPFTAVSPSGEKKTFPSIGEMHREHGVNFSAVHRCLNGKLLTHHGWADFKYIDGDGKVLRFREVDQIKAVIASIKTDPNSRRHVINLWNTPAMEHAELPCCHGSVIQFNVSDGRLSSHVYQRSADILIGVPVNIASYALLTMMVAQVCDLEPGDFIWTGGDCHLYLNHLEQAREQLTREPRGLPKMRINPEVKDIFGFKYEDFTLEGYNPHPHIKAEVAV